MGSRPAAERLIREKDIGRATIASSPMTRQSMPTPPSRARVPAKSSDRSVRPKQSFLDYFNSFIHQLLIALIRACQFEGICQHRFAFFHAGDHIRAAEPVGFGEVGLRPLRRMIGVRMVKADDVLVALAGLTLDVHELLGIDVVAVLRRVGTGVAGAGKRSYDTCAIALQAAEQDTATLVRIGLLAVQTKSVVVGLTEAKHGNSEVRSQHAEVESKSHPKFRKVREI